MIKDHNVSIFGKAAEHYFLCGAIMFTNLKYDLSFGRRNGNEKSVGFSLILVAQIGLIAFVIPKKES